MPGTPTRTAASGTANHTVAGCPSPTTSPTSPPTTHAVPPPMTAKRTHTGNVVTPDQTPLTTGLSTPNEHHQTPAPPPLVICSPTLTSPPARSASRAAACSASRELLHAVHQRGGGRGSGGRAPSTHTALHETDCRMQCIHHRSMQCILRPLQAVHREPPHAVHRTQGCIRAPNSLSGASAPCNHRLRPSRPDHSFAAALDPRAPARRVRADQLPADAPAGCFSQKHPEGGVSGLVGRGVLPSFLLASTGPAAGGGSSFTAPRARRTRPGAPRTLR